MASHRGGHEDDAGPASELMGEPRQGPPFPRLLPRLRFEPDERKAVAMSRRLCLSGAGRSRLSQRRRRELRLARFLVGVMRCRLARRLSAGADLPTWNLLQ